MCDLKSKHEKCQYKQIHNALLCFSGVGICCCLYHTIVQFSLATPLNNESTNQHSFRKKGGGANKQLKLHLW